MPSGLYEWITEAGQRKMSGMAADEKPISTAPTFDISAFDFIDFGCSNGGSIQYGMTKFPGSRGLGIDVNAAKVEATRVKGFDAVQMNALDLKANPRSVRFCILAHFLEHLPALKDARDILTVACNTAREFVLVWHPWFGSDGWLFSQGLKFFWSDWHGHPLHLDAVQLHSILRDARRNGVIRDFAIFGRDAVKDSTAPSVHSVESPKDQHGFDPKVHPAKPYVPFPPGIFRELVAIVSIDADIDDIAKTVGAGKKLYDSREASK